jgi:hypothetical protein
VIFFSYLFKKNRVRVVLDQKHEGKKEGDARIDKGAPALLALFALHPILVERNEVRMRRRRKLREIAQRVLKNLVIVPASAQLSPHPHK